MDYKKSSEWGERSGRLQRMAQQNLGIVMTGSVKKQMYRTDKLNLLDSYYENQQYGNLAPFDTDTDSLGNHIPLRKRAPRIKFAYAKTLAQRVASKLVGLKSFPAFTIPDSPDDEEFFKLVISESKLRSRIIEPVRKCLAVGSVFVRFKIVEATFKIDYYDSKYCYPEFQENGQLERVVVKYVYTDKTDLDSKGNPKRKWFKMELNTMSEILFDNPEYDPAEKSEPKFEVVDEVEHGFGFVQGEWFRTAEKPGSPDGYSLIEDITDFIDELNYNISQSSKAISYNQDPQLVFKGMTTDEVGDVVRSSSKSWQLGRDGDASFIESNLVGAEKALALRDKVKNHIGDISRVLLLDPEKIVGSAQSGHAMEVLHGPFVDLVEELRPMFGDSIKALVLKMGLACLLAKSLGMDSPIQFPPGYRPKSVDIIIKWPEVFPLTIEDMQKKVSLATSAHTGRLISRFTAMRYIQEIFDIKNLDEEAAQIDKEPVINPFGGF